MSDTPHPDTPLGLYYSEDLPAVRRAYPGATLEVLVLAHGVSVLAEATLHDDAALAALSDAAARRGLAVEVCNVYRVGDMLRVRG